MIVSRLISVSLGTICHQRSVEPRDLHSFPTRRSSDLRDKAVASLAPDLAGALDRARSAIERFHRAQLPAPSSVSTSPGVDRKSTRLNSSHGYISYAVFCLKKKIK